MFLFSPVFHRGHMFMNEMYHKKINPFISTLQMTIKKIVITIVCEPHNNYNLILRVQPKENVRNQRFVDIEQLFYLNRFICISSFRKQELYDSVCLVNTFQLMYMLPLCMLSGKRNILYIIEI